MAEDGTDFVFAFFKRLQVILAMVENDAAKGVVDTIVDVIARFAIADGPADDAGERGRSGGDEESARFGKDLDILWKQSVDLSIDLFGEGTEWFYVFIVGRRKAATDIENFDFVSARFGFVHYRGGDVECLNEILEIGALAPDVEAETFVDKAHCKSADDQIHGFTGIATELGRQFHHGAGIGDAETQDNAGVRSILLNLLQLSEIVVRDQGLVLVERLKSFPRFCGISVNDFVPNEILLRLWRKGFDIVVNEHELGERGYIEACAGFVERANDGRFCIGFDSVIGLNFWEMLFERGEIGANDRVIDYHDGCAVFAGDGLELASGHDNQFNSKWLVGFKRFKRLAQVKIS